MVGSVYHEIQRQPLHEARVDLPPAPRLSIPYVPKPKCPDHCSGRHQTEASLECPQHGPSYLLEAHEWFHTPGHWFYTLIPLNGAPESHIPKCRNCAGHLARVDRP